MATGIMIGMAVLAVAGAGYGIYMLNQMKGVAPTTTDMTASTLDSFQVTKVEEGVIVPLIGGRCRISGNLIWYGNYKALPVYDYVTSQVQDGKDTTTVTQEYIKGYSYYLGMIQILCVGPAEIINAWANDDVEDYVLQQYCYTGENNVVPAAVENLNIDGLNSFPGLAVWMAPLYYLGYNTTTVPTIHFLVESIPDIPFTGNKYMDNGINPAYFIYYLYRSAGGSISNIDMDSFIDAATYWYEQGYGVNISFASQSTLREKIIRVLSFVGGYFGESSENKFRLKAFDPEEEESWTLTQDDMIDFQLARKTWDETYNVFNGNFLDEDLSYTKRTVSAVNVANIKLQGSVKSKSIDLTAFRDRETAEKRLWEIAKEGSYPAATISFKTFLEFCEMEIGDVVVISNSDYDLEGGYYRIISKSLKEIDKNYLSWTAQQVVERVMDGNYVATTGSSWVEPSKQPSAPDHQRVFELPWNASSGTAPAYLLLSTKGSAYESGFQVMISSEEDGDYESKGTFGDCALYGTLDVAYTDDTYEIDDDIGIYFTPDSDYPTFDTLTRTQLFSTSRYIIIEDEIMAFQNIDEYGSNGFHLTGVIRGLLNTTKGSYAAGTAIWIVQVGGNVLTGVTSLQFYIKMLPVAYNNVYDADEVDAILVEGTSKAKTPYRIPRVVAIRDDTNLEDVSIEWWPITKDYDGAGVNDPGSITDSTWSLSDQYPLDFDGVFDYRIDSGDWETISDTDISIDNVNSFTFEVRNVVNGVLGEITSLTIDTSAGQYITD